MRSPLRHRVSRLRMAAAPVGLLGLFGLSAAAAAAPADAAQPTTSSAATAISLTAAPRPKLAVRVEDVALDNEGRVIVKNPQAAQMITTESAAAMPRAGTVNNGCNMVAGCGGKKAQTWRATAPST
jgi:hypothetical protein